MAQLIRGRVVSYVQNVNQGVEVELLAVAAFNLFLQLNYTGPSLEKSASPTDDTPLDPLENVNPHSCFPSFCEATIEAGDAITEPKRDDKFHNNVLSELAVDGEWPCQVCQAPYLLLLARSIFHALARPQRPDWMHATASADDTVAPYRKEYHPSLVMQFQI